MPHKLSRPVFKGIAYLAATALVLSALIYLGSGARSIRKAQRLRNEICALEIGKSTFADVSRVFSKYDGYASSHDDVPKSCSPQGCSYVLLVENPLSKTVPIWPRIAFFAKIRVSDNVLKERYLGITQHKSSQSMEIFVQQSVDSKFTEDTRMIEETKMPRKGVQVSSVNSQEFVQLANRLNLNCLALLGTCSQPSDMLPYLAEARANGLTR